MDNDTFHDSVSFPDTDTGDANTQQTLTQHSTINHVAIRLPQFWKEEPELWFIQAEANFKAANVTNETTKYSHILAILEAAILREVMDVISANHSPTPYSILKATLINRFSESGEKKLRRLLADTHIGDLRPTQLLRQMKQLAGTSLSADAIKTLWLQRLPPSVQTVLAASNAPIDDLAVMADRVLDASQSQIMAVTPETQPPSTTGDIENKLDQIINAIKDRPTQKYSNDNTPSQYEPWGRQRSPARYQSQNRKYDNKPHYSPSRQASPHRKEYAKRSESPTATTICWYHEVFGGKARKCSPPCQWKDNPN